MKIDVKTKDEDGNIIFEGKLNRVEVSFLLQYAIADLVSSGVQFHLERDDEEDQMRLDFPAPPGGLQ